MHLNNMAKFDEKLKRMNYLMEFQAPSGKKMTNVEFSTEGADGKIYGILREGTKYYIKTTEKGKETVSESYDYIGGFNNKKSCEYNSYNDATKQLELKLMGLNESLGVKKNVSTVNFNKSKEDFSFLTEEARKELDRMNMIFENSCGIGTGKVGSSAPFDKEAKATLDKDTVEQEKDPKNATGEGYTDVKDADKKLQNADKMENGSNDTAKGDKAPKAESEGVAVAAEEKKGGKEVVVKMNESVFEETPFGEENIDVEDGDIDTIIDNEDEDDLDLDSLLDGYDENIFDDGVNLAGDDEVENLDEEVEKVNLKNAKKSVITGPEDTLDGPNTSDSKSKSVAMGEKHVGNDNGVMEEGVDECGVKECGINEENEGCLEKPKGEDERAMRGPKGNGQHITWDKMNESQKINALVKDVCRKLVSEGLVARKPVQKKKVVKESIQDKIQRMVNEEVTRLNAWGQHPGYRKKPMTLPANKEVMKGSADRDWNDESAKGEQPFGQKIGSSAPFELNVNAITNSVLQEVKRNIKRNLK